MTMAASRAWTRGSPKRRPATRWPSMTAGWVMVVEHGVADDRVVADRLGVEETPVGGEADLPQGGQVAQSFADPEVPGVVDGGLGAKGSSFLVILLDLGVACTRRAGTG
jgi:hypothetical protein